MRITRLLDRPIIEPATHPSIGSNIQGPSLVRTPAWLADPALFVDVDGRTHLLYAVAGESGIAIAEIEW
ncbi:MAG TPA: hypothetical protein VMW08_04170 [Acidimicrobiales bacterium]|nr:hypothetical protein [Acidimicrobiales bacterium]